MVQHIKEIKKQFNKSTTGFLTQLDFIAKTNISKGTIRYHFGSWNEALEAADVDDPELKSVRANGTLEVSDSELLNDLYLLYQETNKEPNEYLIKTNFDTYTNSYPFNVLYGYDEIKLLVTQDSTIKDVLLMTDYLRHSSDSTYILAFHLENGSCLIFDKKKNKIIPKIEMEKYIEGGPMTSTGGRIFYINGKLFISVDDMIS